MKKLIMMVMTALLVVCVLAGCSGGSKLPEGFDEETLKKQAIADIELASSDDFEGWKGRFGTDLQAQLTEETYKGFLETLKSKGAFKEYGKSAFVGQEQDGKKYAACVIIVKYAEGDIQYSVGYDEEMNLVQFTIK